MAHALIARSQGTCAQVRFYSLDLQSDSHFESCKCSGLGLG